MLEPHATEIRQELVRVRVGSLHHAARPSHAGPLRRAVGNAFVRLGLLLGSDGSVPPSITQPRVVRGPRLRGPHRPIQLRNRPTAFARAGSISPGRPRRRTAFESARRSFERRSRSDPVLPLHQLEAAIHVVQAIDAR